MKTSLPPKTGEQRVPLPFKFEPSVRGQHPRQLDAASPYSLVWKCHLFIDRGWLQRGPVSQGKRSLPFSLVLSLVVAALVKEQEAFLAKGLTAAGAAMPRGGLVARCSGGVMT